MKRMLICVSGRTGAGKTTFVRTASIWANIRGVYPGQECRKWFGAGAFAVADDPGAPEFSEMFVTGAIAAACACGEPVVVVDGYPRNPSQFNEMKRLALIYGRGLYLFVLGSPEDLLRKRLDARDKSEDERALSKRRLETDVGLEARLQVAAREHGVPVRLVYNNNLLTHFRQHVLKLVMEAVGMEQEEACRT